jgi:hypothetical protein
MSGLPWWPTYKAEKKKSKKDFVYRDDKFNIDE